MLRSHGYAVQTCPDLTAVSAQLDNEVGVVMLTEESLATGAGPLEATLRAQPAWSDPPFIMLTSRPRGGAPAPTGELGRLLSMATNVVLLERPLGARSLLSAIDTAMRSRKRQFDLRDRMEELRESHQALEHKVAERTAELEAEMASRVRAEAALRQSQKMEAIGQLTGGIAHDFNNMLTGIMGSLDLMRRRLAAGQVEHLDRYMDAASVSASRAAALTQRLLAFARRQSLDARNSDLNVLVQGIQDLLSRSVSEQITLGYRLSKDQPAAVVDANQLESAILNLTLNARDAMPAGGQVTIATDQIQLSDTEAAGLGIRPGAYAIVAVSDTGVGMPPDLLERVFDPFFTTKPLGQGTGLGLSMVYGFVKQSDGQIRITSSPGQGTTVTLYFPASTERPAPGGAPVSAFAHEGAGQTVLVIEDDPSVRMLVQDLLEGLGYRVTAAAEPLAALPLLASSQQVDLLVSDVGLPGMSGRELAEIARSQRPDLPILFITGYAQNAAMRADFLGANMALITKPFALDELALKIDEMVSGAKTPLHTS